MVDEIIIDDFYADLRELAEQIKEPDTTKAD